MFLVLLTILSLVYADNVTEMSVQELKRNLEKKELDVCDLVNCKAEKILQLLNLNVININKFLGCCSIERLITLFIESKDLKSYLVENTNDKKVVEALKTLYTYEDIPTLRQDMLLTLLAKRVFSPEQLIAQDNVTTKAVLRAYYTKDRLNNWQKVDYGLLKELFQKEIVYFEQLKNLDRRDAKFLIADYYFSHGEYNKTKKYFQEIGDYKVKRYMERLSYVKLRAYYLKGLLNRNQLRDIKSRASYRLQQQIIVKKVFLQHKENEKNFYGSTYDLPPNEKIDALITFADCEDELISFFPLKLLKRCYRAGKIKSSVFEWAKSLKKKRLESLIKIYGDFVRKEHVKQLTSFAAKFFLGMEYLTEKKIPKATKIFSEIPDEEKCLFIPLMSIDGLELAVKENIFSLSLLQRVDSDTIDVLLARLAYKKGDLSKLQKLFADSKFSASSKDVLYQQVNLNVRQYKNATAKVLWKLYNEDILQLQDLKSIRTPAADAVITAVLHNRDNIHVENRYLYRCLSSKDIDKSTIRFVFRALSSTKLRDFKIQNSNVATIKQLYLQHAKRYNALNLQRIRNFYKEAKKLKQNNLVFLAKKKLEMARYLCKDSANLKEFASWRQKCDFLYAQLMNQVVNEDIAGSEIQEIISYISKNRIRDYLKREKYQKAIFWIERLLTVLRYDPRCAWAHIKRLEHDLREWRDEIQSLLQAKKNEKKRRQQMLQRISRLIKATEKRVEMQIMCINALQKFFSCKQKEKKVRFLRKTLRKLQKDYPKISDVWQGILKSHIN
jgi:hypothetical protein